MIHKKYILITMNQSLYSFKNILFVNSIKLRSSNKIFPLKNHLNNKQNHFKKKTKRLLFSVIIFFLRGNCNFFYCSWMFNCVVQCWRNLQLPFIVRVVQYLELYFALFRFFSFSILFFIIILWPNILTQRLVFSWTSTTTVGRCLCFSSITLDL